MLRNNSSSNGSVHSITNGQNLNNSTPVSAPTDIFSVGTGVPLPLNADNTMNVGIHAIEVYFPKKVGLCINPFEYGLHSNNGFELSV